MAAPTVNPYAPPGPQQYVVSVSDSVTETLCGHPSLTYTSPPQPYRQALNVVVGLLGHPPAPSVSGERSGRWTKATAGGRRVVTLVPQHQGEDHGNAARC